MTVHIQWEARDSGGLMETVIGATPIVVHIPDAPTEAEVMAVLEHLEFGVCFFQLGEPVPLPRHMPPGGQAYNLVPVTRIRWIESVDRTLATVYIEGKPYTFPTNWLEDHQMDWTQDIRVREIKASA